MVMVVAHPVLVTSGGAGGLDPTDETLVDEDAERVVDRLPGDRADLVPHDLGQLFGGGVRAGADGLHDRQTLCGDLEPATSQLLLEALLLDRIMSEGLLLRGVGHDEQVKQTFWTQSRV